MTLQLPEAIAGVEIPDTALLREVTEFIRDAEDDLLFDHSRRVFVFAALRGRRLGVQPDLSLLYIAAMFHDLGLTQRYRSSKRRFEVDSADAARDFLLDRGVDAADIRKVWLGIALHTTQGVPQFMEPEVALVKAGVETDVIGAGRDDLDEDAIAAIITAHPRPGFKRGFLRALTDGLKFRPHTTFGVMNADVLEHYDPTFVRDDFVEMVLNSSWPE